MIFGQRLFEWTPRGDSIDGWECRWYVTKLLLWGWWRGGWRVRFLGHGPGNAAKALRMWASQMQRELPVGEAHADALQFLYEYGLVGGAAMLAFVVPILMHLRLGDPWSAAWITVTVMSFIHWPLHHPVLGPMWLVMSARLWQ